MLRHYAALNRTATYHLPVWLRAAGFHQHAMALAQASHVPPQEHQDHHDRLYDLLTLLSDTESVLEDHPPSAGNRRHSSLSYHEDVAEAGTRCLVRYKNNPPDDQTDQPDPYDQYDPYPEILEISAAATRIASKHMTNTLRMGREGTYQNTRRIITHLQYDTARTVAQIAALGR